MRHVLLASILLFSVFTVACGGSSNAPVVNATEAKKETEAPKDAKQLSFSGEGSKVEWVGRKVTGLHNGGFKTFTGKAWVSADGKTLEKVEVDIDVASVFTDSDGLTKHLKTDDFFNIEKYPKARFVTTEVKAGETYTLTGNLTLRETTKSVSFPAKVKIADGKLSASAEFQFNRMDFGVKYAGKENDLIKDMVDLKLNIEAR